MKHTLILLLIAASIAVSIPPTQLLAQQAKVENLVQLETGGCRGYCPVYKLTFRKDGVLDYLGTRNVEKIGAQTARLSAEEYAQLLKAVTIADLWQYPAEIASNVADAPLHIFTVFDGEKTQVVRGKTGIPEPILALETKMQDIAEAHGFSVKKGFDPKNPDYLKGSVIVKFSMDTNAKNFCTQFSDLKVRPIRLLSEDNTWVIGFNPSELTEEQFISLLKDMRGVLTVEPDKQTKGRN